MKQLRIVPRGAGRYAVVRYTVAHRADGSLVWRADMIVRGAATMSRLQWEGYVTESFGSLHGAELTDAETAAYYRSPSRGK